MMAAKFKKNVSTYYLHTFKILCVKFYESRWPNENIYRKTFVGDFVVSSEITHSLQLVRKHPIYENYMKMHNLSIENATMKSK